MSTAGACRGRTESDASTSTQDEEEENATHTRKLVCRQRRRRKLIEEFAKEEGQGLTLLESRAVKRPTREKYLKEVRAWLEHHDATAAGHAADGDVDASLCTYMTNLWAQGQQSYTGEALMAGLLHFMPEFNKFGDKKIPRAWRALRGWRLLTPARSRRPVAWPIWAGVCWELCRQGFYLRALYVLLMVTTYMRPGEPLSMQRQDLVPPTTGVSTGWSILLYPDTRAARSKVHAKNETVDVQSELAPWLESLMPLLAQGPPDERVFPFSYHDFLRSWRQAVSQLPLDLVPYQARHSGASLDAARGLRTRKQIMDRGRWRSQSSLLRYEKHARLAGSLASLEPVWRVYFEQAAELLEGLLCGRLGADALQLPVTHGSRRRPSAGTT